MTLAEPVDAVLFDLDDTIYLQQDWLDGAWAAVAAAAGRQGLNPGAVRRALFEVAGQGSDQGRIIDRALAKVPRGPGIEMAALVAAFHGHRPASVDCFPGAREALACLRERVSIALVTDGNVGVQLAKLNALGLTDAFDAVITSDSLGRQYRKPNPAPFIQALEVLAVPAGRAVMVGDRPGKDTAGAIAAGIRCVRVLTGEYARCSEEPVADATVPDVVAAVGLIYPLTRSLRAPVVGSARIRHDPVGARSCR